MCYQFWALGNKGHHVHRQQLCFDTAPVSRFQLMAVGGLHNLIKLFLVAEENELQLTNCHKKEIAFVKILIPVV
jgi:hypothetical protein